MALHRRIVAPLYISFFLRPAKRRYAFSPYAEGKLKKLPPCEGYNLFFSLRSEIELWLAKNFAIGATMDCRTFHLAEWIFKRIQSAVSGSPPTPARPNATVSPARVSLPGILGVDRGSQTSEQSSDVAEITIRMKFKRRGTGLRRPRQLPEGIADVAQGKIKETRENREAGGSDVTREGPHAREGGEEQRRGS